MSETKVRVRSTLGVTDHNLLDNRFTNDQHTMNSISGLEDALESKQKKLIPGENIEITPEGEISAIIPEVSFANITGEVTDNEQLTAALSEKADVDDVPVNTSDLNNDSDFITHTDIEGKQDALNSAQMNAVNSGITSAKVTEFEGKQDALNSNQVAAVNSGITIEKVTEFEGKQDAISDLATIRSGAALGATALQSIDSTAVVSALGYTPYDSANPSNYATESAVAAKQDALNSDQLAAVNSGANSTNIGQIATNTSVISGIEAKIPAQASDQNQLADKAFVNSSVSTNTATFRGTYQSVADLEAYAGDKDNNDYAFVTGEDSLGNTYYDNYVYNGTSWVYRYRLNNSSFTAAQWDAINSGATTANIGQIATNTTAIAGKQDTISDLATIRSGAALGATALQSITSGNVTTALGYTPYDSANPSGYITSSALSPYAQSANLATVATSGSYNDLSNKPTIPAAQVNADWNADSGVSQILNKPTIPAAQIQSDWNQSDNSSLDYIKNKPSIPAAQVNSDWNASSGVAEILNKPTIPTVNNSTITLTQGGTTKGTFTLNQSTNSTIDFDMGGSSVEPDESSINFNSANKLQSVGFINARTGSAMRLWEGTESQWNNGASQTWYNWTGTDGYFKFNSSTILVNGVKRYPNLAYGDGKFMLIDPSVSGKGNISTNGSSWVGIDAPTTYNPPSKKALTYGNGKFILLKGSNNTVYITEDFGTTWQEYNTLPFNGTYIYFVNDKFFCFGSGTDAAYSSDGVTWTNITTLPSSNKIWSSISFGNGVYVATANSNSSGDHTTKGAYSTDGINWTETTLSSTASAWNSFYANGIFIAIPLYFSTGVAAYSTDGINWSPTTLPSNDLGASLSDIAFGKVNGVNRFIIFSNNGTMASSTDGINWSKFNYKISAMTNLGGAAYGNEIFVVSFIGTSTNPYQVFWSTGGHTFSCFTTDSAPTTSSQVYSAPNITSALTITSVGTGTITLSDTNTYNYNASGNQTITQSIGEAHPDWLCFIEGVGIKKGTTTIANNLSVTVDQTYDATSANAQSGVAVASGIADSLGTINTQLESIIAQGD